MKDALWLIVAGVMFWVASYQLDLFDRLVAFVENHESWELDEIILAALSAGTMGFIYAARRYSDLKVETARREAAEQEARWNADRDSLTGLFNRRYLEDYLANVPEDRRLSVMMVDLNGFKKINDLRGHSIGDRILCAIADRIRSVRPDIIATRYGGDEFIVLLPGEDPTGAGVVATDMLDALDAPILIDGEEYRIGAAIGLASMPHHSTEASRLVHKADLAMYQAKRREESSFEVFHPWFLTDVEEAASSEQQLRDAIRDETIQPYYQPLVELENGRIVGCEALARWFREDGTQVPPSTFIPLAEKLGLIDELFESLLRRACMDAKEWDERVTLSFNLSASQLDDVALPYRVASILSETGFLPSRLELELTESTFVQNAEVALDTIVQLKALGVRIALDDFGTGYSSLSQLARLKIDRVKIDRSFVMQCMADERSMSVLQAIVALSQTLKLATTAEGIEQNDQYLELQRAGCDLGQGFLFSRALSPSDFQDWLNRMAVPDEKNMLRAAV
ncbi:bifunctional diguanylate cyclase/phosphodiesterase [Notoacmeibacter sp. MSK16QG-6]|uniref:putative bifunctional diguanylate cyclase/phosphodiesterase n=1 Tax=Notoacmeibacter sp. MSK16QG-6 TaxID=2957982 RepID=UPI0020A1CD4E|nr:bifunctional diguanylate cyclase/phosphodiesterase [Notoacmeibacter sp. MSK16QG-6]MCP1199974.1 bifunctional diguanylate cyclase/phosphodiesterase [Notoacmeibacter sp. MSK16QG-6]